MIIVLSIIMYLGVFVLTKLLLRGTKSLYSIRFRVATFDFSRVVRFVCFVFSISLVVFLSSFRINIGTDYLSFEREYNWCMTNLDSYDQLKIAVDGYNDEPAVFILMKLGGSIFGSFRGFLFLASLLTVCPVLIAFLIYDKKQYDYCFYIYLLVLYLSSYNGIHQHISVSWCLLAVVLAYKYHYISSVLIILLASSFHQTALFTFVFLLLVYWSKKNVDFKVGVVLIVSLCSIVGMKLILSIMSRIPMMAKYAYAFADNYELSFNFIIMHMFFKIPLLILIILNYKCLIRLDNRNFALIAYTLFDVVFVFSAIIMRWTMRMQYYTLSIAPLMMTNIFYCYRQNEQRRALIFVKVIMITTYILRFIVLFGVYKYDSVVPYQYSFG